MCTLLDRGKGRDRVKETWLKLCECEARTKFWSDIVCLGVGTNELENIGESLHEKFKSKKMASGSEERSVIEEGAKLKLRDEKRYWRELKTVLEKEKRSLRDAIGSCWKYRKKIDSYKKEVSKHKKEEMERLKKKIDHLLKLRENIEEEKMEK